MTISSKSLAFAHALVLVLALAFAGCSDSDGGTDASSSDAAATDGGGAADLARNPDTAGPRAKVCGVLVDSSGSKLEGFELQLCSELVCLTDRSKADGSFCISVAEPAVYVFHTIALDANAGKYAELLFPYEVVKADIDKENRVDIGEVKAVALGASKPLDVKAGGKVDLGRVSIDVPAGVTTPPLFSGDTIDVAAAFVAKADVDKRLPAADARVTNAVAILGLMPLKTKFSTGVALTLGGIDASPGQKLTILHVNSDTGALETVGSATVSQDGKSLSTAAGSGPTTLGWLFFVP